jgi:hypothetical protein
MTPEFLLALMSALGLSGIGATWWARRGQRDHVNRVRTEWVRSAQLVHYGPVGAVCYGTRPRRVYTRGGEAGALGLTGGKLVFDGQRRSTYDTSVPFAQVRWIGLRLIAVRRYTTTRALIVHAERPGGWQVFSYTLDDPHEFGQVLSRECDLPLRDRGEEREDFGPAPATRLFQDIYGEWTPDREDALYLAPDRLLFDWGQPIMLGTIARLDVYTQPDRSADLLRITYTPPGDDEPAVVGFAVRAAKAWADAINSRTAAPIAVHAGRKHKSS